MQFEPYFRDYLVKFAQDKKPLWNYEAGVTLLGAQWLYEVTGDEFYRDRIFEFMDHHILPDGTIRYLDPNELNLDKINSGKILFFLYDQTHDERYKKAMDVLVDMLHRHPRTSTGNFWHKTIYPYQIWLDGLYMALPFYLEYDRRFGDGKAAEDVLSQLTNVRRLMYSDKDHLYYHAYDEKKVMIWADPETGLSHNFWLRSIGWHLMALIDLYEISSRQEQRYADWFREALSGVLEYQDKDTKLFYQLIALPEVPGNYIETSGSAMVAYSVLKGVRMGVLPEDPYRAKGEEMLKALHDQKLVCIDGVQHLKDICEVAGLGPKDERDGSVEYYLSEPIVCDEVKGVGATMMAYAEHLKLEKQV